MADADLILGHRHEFLGSGHSRNERRTWAVVILCTGMMLLEIIGGTWFGSLALVADGWHMSTHAGALLLAALAYRYARRHSDDPRFVFGTGKLGDLAAFSSAIILAIIAVLIGYSAICRLLSPVHIDYTAALPIAALGLAVNLTSAWLLAGDHHHSPQHGHADPHEHDGHHHEHESEDHHEHGQGHSHAHGHKPGHHHSSDAVHRDNNIRAAFVHVFADGAVSILVIMGLLAARYLGWVWMDPVMGIIGALVIANWSIGLIRSTVGILVDMTPDEELPRLIREEFEKSGDAVTDLHLWRVGPGHLSVIVALASAQPEPPSNYKARLAAIAHFSHITIEVQPMPGKTTFVSSTNRTSTDDYSKVLL